MDSEAPPTDQLEEEAMEVTPSALAQQDTEQDNQVSHYTTLVFEWMMVELCYVYRSRVLQLVMVVWQLERSKCKKNSDNNNIIVAFT